MNIDIFLREYSGLADYRKREGLDRLFAYIVNDINQNEDLILDILDLAEMAEANDYFGTEGLDI